MTASNPNGIASGISVNGLPLAITNPGEIFWVNSSTVLPKRGAPGRADSGVAITGKGTYNRPFATINQALAKCVANRGDIVLIMPGYTETNAVTGSTGFTLNVAGTAVVGLGSGTLKPNIISTHTGSTVDITADDCLIYNVRFVAGVATQTVGVDVTGADVTIDSCDFVSNTGASFFVTAVLTSNLTFGFHFTNNIVNMLSTTIGTAVDAGPAQALSIDGDNTVIKGNIFLGDFSVSLIFNTTTAIEGGIFTDNFGANTSTDDAEGAVSLASGATGMLYRNNFGSLDSTAIKDIVVSEGMGVVETFVVNVEAETGGPPGTSVSA